MAHRSGLAPFAALLALVSLTALAQSPAKPGRADGLQAARRYIEGAARQAIDAAESSCRSYREARSRNEAADRGRLRDSGGLPSPTPAWKRELDARFEDLHGKTVAEADREQRQREESAACGAGVVEAGNRRRQQLDALNKAALATLEPQLRGALEQSPRALTGPLAELAQGSCSAAGGASAKAVADDLFDLREWMRLLDTTPPASAASCLDQCQLVARATLRLCRAAPASLVDQDDALRDPVVGAATDGAAGEASCGCASTRSELGRVVNGRRAALATQSGALAAERTRRAAVQHAENERQSALQARAAAESARRSEEARAAALEISSNRWLAKQWHANAAAAYTAGRYEQAAEELRKVLAKEPAHAAALELLPETLRRQTPPDVAGAITAYRSLPNAYNRVAVLQALIELEGRSGRWSEVTLLGAHWAQRANAAERRSTQTWAWIARGRKEQGQVSGALDAAQRAFEGDPTGGGQREAMQALVDEMGARLQAQQVQQAAQAERQREAERLLPTQLSERVAALRQSQGSRIDDPALVRARALTPSDRQGPMANEVAVLTAALPVMETHRYAPRVTAAAKWSCGPARATGCIDLARELILYAREKPRLGAEVAPAALKLVVLLCAAAGPADPACLLAEEAADRAKWAQPERRYHVVGYRLERCAIQARDCSALARALVVVDDLAAAVGFYDLACVAGERTACDNVAYTRAQIRPPPRSAEAVAAGASAVLR